MSKIVSSIIGLLILIGAAGLVYYWVHHQKEILPDQTSHRQLNIKVAKPQKGYFFPTRKMIGWTSQSQPIQLSAPVMGKINRIFVRMGDVVEPGAPLIEFDREASQLEKNDLEQSLAHLDLQHNQLQKKKKYMQTQLNNIGQRMELAQKQYKRSLLSLEKNQISQATLDTLHDQILTLAGQKNQMSYEKKQLDTQFEEIEIKRQEITNQIKKLDIQMENLYFKAHQAGEVVGIYSSEKQFVNPGQVLIDLSTTKSLELHVPIPQELKDQNHFTAYIYDDSGAEFAFPFLRKALNQRNRLTPHLIFQANPDMNLQEREYKKVFIRGHKAIEGFLIDRSCLYESDIYRVNDGKLEAVPIQILGYVDGLHGSKVIVQSEQLDKRDLIMTSHIPQAISGLKVRVNE